MDQIPQQSQNTLSLIEEKVQNNLELSGIEKDFLNRTPLTYINTGTKISNQEMEPHETEMFLHGKGHHRSDKAAA